MQQEAVVKLVGGGTLIAAVTVAAALAYVVGFGDHSVRSVAPLVGAFMRAGAADDALAGHRLFSATGLNDLTRDDLATLYARRELFEGFDHVRVRLFRVRPPAYPAGAETGTVVATVYYVGRPPARLDAELDLEAGGWRLRTVRITREGT
jgi:hypothetical protein